MIGSDRRKIAIGCLGVSHPHASGRVRAMRRHGDIEIAGAADEDGVLEPFTRALNLQPRTVEEILSDPSVDAVLIHSKSEKMVEYSCRAMLAGKSVLVEKPGGRTLADLAQLQETSAQTGKICQIGYNFRFSPAVEAMHKAIHDGSLGKVVQVRGHCACSFNEAATSHLNQPGDMGGALFVIGSHVIDLIIHHFGMPSSVNARVPKFDGLMDPKFREDAAVAILNYPKMIASFDFFSWDPLPWLESWQIDAYGTDGIMHANPLPSKYRKFMSPRDQNIGGWTEWQQSSFPVAWSADKTEYSPELAEILSTEFFDREMDAFVSASTGRSEVAIPPSQAYNVALLIDALYRSSSQNGAEVIVGPITVAN